MGDHAPPEDSPKHQTPPVTPTYPAPGALCKAFVEHAGYVSDKWEHYLPIYEAAFAGVIARGRPIRFLEIGVQNGGSLQIWSKYFPAGSRFVGLDIDPACASLVMDSNISVRIGDASDPATLDHLLGDETFDVIVDDGSHRSEHIISTFRACFGRLNPGGLYVVEDLHTSYWKSYGGGFRSPEAAIEHFKGLADALNANYFESDALEGSHVQEMEYMKKLGESVAGISFFDSLCIIEKLKIEKRFPYQRSLTGRESPVVDIAGSIASDPLGTRKLLLSPQLRAEVTRRDDGSDHLRAAIARQHHENETLRTEIETLSRTNDALHKELTSRVDEIKTQRETSQTLADKLNVYVEMLSKLENDNAIAIATSRQLTKNLTLARFDRNRLKHEIDILLRSMSRRARRAMQKTKSEKQLRASPWSALFDSDWYLKAYPDVAAAGVSPLEHYVRHGAAEGRDPNPLFNTVWYLQTNSDVTDTGTNPLQHYWEHGAAEGRDPNPSFSSSFYLERNRDVAKAGVNPLLHYLRTGKDEGRPSYSRLPQSGVTESRHIDASSQPGAQCILYISGEPETPGHIYRVTQYMKAAEANGYDVLSVSQRDVSHIRDDFANYEIAILWRCAWNDELERTISVLRKAGALIVFDCDDLMTEPDLAKTNIIDGIRTQFLTEDTVRNHYRSVRQTMIAADVCFATTDELAFYMRCAGKPAYTLPNGFSQATHDLSRSSAREWMRRSDDLIRIGYAGGSRTHQRDLGLAIDAIARILKEHSNCRLVLFQSPDGKSRLIDVEEYPALEGLLDRIEWRPLQPLEDLPTEMARFDINLAPLEVGNPFCEAKSELKFFEAALVNVPTIASPTGPFRRAIRHGQTGFLATTGDDWRTYLTRLIEDPGLRKRIAHEAYLAALATFGPLQRALQFGRVLDQLDGGARGARGFALGALLSSRPSYAPRVLPSDVVFEKDKGGDAKVSVIIPLHNYSSVVVETLESVRKQTLERLDLVIVDDDSSDASLKVAQAWAVDNAHRFNRIALLKNRANYGLGLTRNVAFDATDTPYVLPLDADNRLLPECCEKLLQSIERSPAAYVYPTIQLFGGSSERISNVPYDPQRLVGGNYIDAMALISKEAWAMVGGYVHVQYGWEDYDFWCRFAEIGLMGAWCEEILAEYRVHERSMMKTNTMFGDNYRKLNLDYARRHPWVSLVHTHLMRGSLLSEPKLRKIDEQTRLDRILPVLRCPESGLKLAYDPDRSSLVSLDRMHTWPIVEGRPVLSRDLPIEDIKVFDHISNEIPDNLLALIRETKGLVLNLSAGGSKEKFEHVIEVEYAIFRHTDVLADAHHLPFEDECFEFVMSMNAFEHYREPKLVAAELRRVLKPGGRIYIRTAFLQPLHEKPWHFYNATRYGVAEWFKAFDTEALQVSDNFCPNHTLSWIASEAEAALRADLSGEAADAFRADSIGSLVDLWRDPTKRSTRLWTDFAKVSADRQDVISAGFEFIGRKPHAPPVR